LVNLDELSRFESGSEITPEKLVAAGLVKSSILPVKILAEGTIKNSLIVRVHKFSAAARAKIEAAGGSVEEMAYAPKAN
jgi:large subunit ribosomal protein L15